MTPDELKAVAVTIELIENSPPKAEHWFVDGHGVDRLGKQVRDWLKEKL